TEIKGGLLDSTKIADLKAYNSHISSLRLGGPGASVERRRSNTVIGTTITLLRPKGGMQRFVGRTRQQPCASRLETVERGRAGHATAPVRVAWCFTSAAISGSTNLT